MVDNDELAFFYKKPQYQKEGLIYKNTKIEKIKEGLEKSLAVFDKIEEKNFTKEDIKNNLMELANDSENRGEILHPVRFALSGLDKSPDPFILADILGKKESILRLNDAISLLN